MKKKISAIILALCMVAGLSACGEKGYDYIDSSMEENQNVFQEEQIEYPKNEDAEEVSAEEENEIKFSEISF